MVKRLIRPGYVTVRGWTNGDGPTLYVSVSYKLDDRKTVVDAMTSLINKRKWNVTASMTRKCYFVFTTPNKDKRSNLTLIRETLRTVGFEPSWRIRLLACIIPVSRRYIHSSQKATELSKAA